MPEVPCRYFHPDMMRNYLRKLCFAMMALPMLMVSAQSVIPLGWTVRQEPGKTIVTPIATGDSAVAITIYAQEELHGASLAMWLQARVAQDIQSRGTPVTQGNVSHANNAFMVLNTYSDGRGQKYLILYTAIQKPAGKAQLATVRSPADATAQSNLRQAGAIIGNLTRGPESLSAQQSSASSAAASTVPSTQPLEGSRGVDSARIAAILHEGRGTSTPMGFRYIESVDLLLTDGTMYDMLKVPPEDFDVELSRKNEPQYWHHWHKQGESYYRQDARTDQWTKIDGDLVKPLEQGSTLSRALANRNYNSAGISAGSSSSARLTLYPDGRYDRSSTVVHSGGNLSQGTSSATSTQDKYGTRSSTSSVGAGRSVVVNSRSQSTDGTGMTGTYRVSGYTLELRSTDGRIQHLLAFYPFPNANPPNHSIYIDGASYSDIQ
jgi:hypothetical protein